MLILFVLGIVLEVASQLRPLQLPQRTAIEGARNTSTRECRVLVSSFYFHNWAHCRARSREGNNNADNDTFNSISTIFSYDARLCTREESCDAAFKCRITEDYYICPWSFIEPFFQGEFQMLCNGNVPHAHLMTSDQGDRIAECISTSEVVAIEKKEKKKRRQMKDTLRLNMRRIEDMPLAAVLSIRLTDWSP